MSALILLRGNSGSGKTTVAKLLQRRLGHNVMLLQQDAVRREMLRVKDGPDTPAVPLLCELLAYGKEHCQLFRSIAIFPPAAKFCGGRLFFAAKIFSRILRKVLTNCRALCYYCISKVVQFLQKSPFGQFFIGSIVLFY